LPNSAYAWAYAELKRPPKPFLEPKCRKKPFLGTKKWLQTNEYEREQLLKI
jgi:hypothetical protein